MRAWLRPRTARTAAQDRERMVSEQLAARGIHDAATLAAMRIVPREAFVGDRSRRHAYEDRALSIGHGQTISQPYMVAKMTASLDVAGHGWPWARERPPYLDVGTGSGYQAAVLAQLGARVISLERDARLAEAARERLATLGYDVEIIVTDGSDGYEAEAPYAGIVVGAAAPTIPEPLTGQLDEGGRLVVPVGPRSTQRLMVVRRTGDTTQVETSDACVFVPLIGAHGYGI